ncbi:universal stress protein [Halobellus salinisoli]|uniref:universal stress protein n=1 Tax=Halobellus salinisoli TaxID=3108500 RepID=UPI00300AC82D
MTILDHVLLPIASEEDAISTCEAIEPHLSNVGRVTAIHVIEKAEGAIDKAPIGKRREDAAAFLSVVEERIGDEVVVETRTVFGRSVVEAIFDTATEVDATAVAFRPRGGNRIARLLAGDTATNIVTNPAVPVVSLPLRRDD